MPSYEERNGASVCAGSAEPSEPSPSSSRLERSERSSSGREARPYADRSSEVSSVGSASGVTAKGRRGVAGGSPKSAWENAEGSMSGFVNGSEKGFAMVLSSSGHA